MRTHVLNHGSSHACRRLALLCLAGCVVVFTTGTSKHAPLWAGRGKHRILVRVDPLDISKRAADEMPARIHISAQDLRAREGGKIDVASLEVEQYNPRSGEPVHYGKWAYAR